MGCLSHTIDHTHVLLRSPLAQAWARDNAEVIEERRQWIAEKGVPLAKLQVLKV